MTGDKNQIVGVMRFSYISKGGFAHSHDAQEDQEAMIYDADRMERRFQLFEDFALRSLKYQTDQDFKCVFLITTTFPKHYRERLEDLVAGWPPGVIIDKPFMPQFRAIRMCYEMMEDERCDWYTSFRLDDDDMLDMRFIERMRARDASSKTASTITLPVVMYLAPSLTFMWTRPVCST